MDTIISNRVSDDDDDDDDDDTPTKSTWQL
jgi:hypothetical protein